MKRFVSSIVVTALALALPWAAHAQGIGDVTTEIISVSSTGRPMSTGDRHTWALSGISNDGRFVVFVSGARLTPDDLDGTPDIYVRDRVAGTTRLLTPAGFYGGDTSYPFGTFGISGDGNYVALLARRLVTSGTTTTAIDALLLIDQRSGAVEVVKEGVSIGSRLGVAIDFDGDVYFFDNINVYTGGLQIFIYDRQARVIRQLYASSARYAANYRLSVDDAGERLCFAESSSTTLASLNVYMLDVATGAKTLVSATADGAPATAFSAHCKISKSGNFAVFHSWATNLDSADYPTFAWNLFLYDLQQQRVEKLDFSDPQLGYLYPSLHLYNLGIADVSDDGRYVAVLLTTSDYNSHQYGAVLDRETGAVVFLPDGVARDNMLHPLISPSGRYVVSTGVTTQANGVFVLLYDLFGANLHFAVEAGADQVVEQASPQGAQVVLAGLLSEGACPDGLFHWSWDGGEAIGDSVSVLLPPGPTPVTLAWSGCDSAATDSLLVTVQDTIAPTAELTLRGRRGEGDWYRGPVAISLTGADAGSGVRELRYRLDGGSERVTTGAVASFTVAASGSHRVELAAVDYAGNVSMRQVVAFAIDSLPPRVAAIVTGQTTDAGVFVSDVTVTLSAVDAVSGVAQLVYSIDGAAWQTTGDPATLSLADDGLHTIDFFATDVAGNSAPVQSVALLIDRTLLTLALVEDVRQIIDELPMSAFLDNSPNYGRKLLEEVDKILEELLGVPALPTPFAQILAYDWIKKKLEIKIAAEAARVIVDPVAVELIAAEIRRAAAAIDVQIGELSPQL